MTKKQLERDDIMNTLTESSKKYLETILIINIRQGYVRSIDISKEMQLSKSSVSNKIKKLEQKGLIILDQNQHIHLTKTGCQKAEELHKECCEIEDFLRKIGVDPDDAGEDARRIRHSVSDVTFEAIRELNKKIESQE